MSPKKAKKGNARKKGKDKAAPAAAKKREEAAQTAAEKKGKDTAGQTAAKAKAAQKDKDKEKKEQKKEVQGARPEEDKRAEIEGVQPMEFELVDNAQRCAAVVQELLRKPEIAVDIEGVFLCRSGEVCIIQVADETGKVYLFDITILSSTAFEEGRLRELLESTHVAKVVFDGRADNDALSHIYGIAMRNIYDLQILHALKFGTSGDKYVKGLEKCLEAAAVVPLQDKVHMTSIKEQGKRLFAPDLGGSFAVWQSRPLQQALIDYAIADVKYMLAMKRRWAAPSLDGLVQSLAEERIQKAIAGSQPAKGQHMALRDFPLTGGEAAGPQPPQKRRRHS